MVAAPRVFTVVDVATGKAAVVSQPRDRLTKVRLCQRLQALLLVQRPAGYQRTASYKAAAQLQRAGTPVPRSTVLLDADQIQVAARTKHDAVPVVQFHVEVIVGVHIVDEPNVCHPDGESRLVFGVEHAVVRARLRGVEELAVLVSCGRVVGAARSGVHRRL